LGACSGLPPLSGPIPVDEPVIEERESGDGFCGWYGFGVFGSVRGFASSLFDEEACGVGLVSFRPL